MKSLIDIYLDKIRPLIKEVGVGESGEIKASGFVDVSYALSILEETGQRVINYCRRSDIPPSLRHTVASMARDFLIADISLTKSLSPSEESLLDQVDIKHVKKIAIGDTEVQLSTAKERGETGQGLGVGALERIHNALMSSYIYDLTHHRRIVFTGHHTVNIHE